MQSVEIQAIDNNDFDIWLPLWKDYQRFYKVDIPESVTLHTWARFLDPAEPMYAVLAMVDDPALGLVHSIYHRSSWATEDYCYLQDLFVAADARGNGIGRTLIEHVYDDARRRGASRLARNFLDGAAREKECVADQFPAEFARYLSNQRTHWDCVESTTGVLLQ